MEKYTKIKGSLIETDKLTWEDFKIFFKYGTAEQFKRLTGRDAEITEVKAAKKQVKKETDNISDNGTRAEF